jgi:hypothetical protein
MIDLFKAQEALIEYLDSLREELGLHFEFCVQIDTTYRDLVVDYRREIPILPKPKILLDRLRISEHDIYLRDSSIYPSDRDYIFLKASQCANRPFFQVTDQFYQDLFDGKPVFSANTPPEIVATDWERVLGLRPKSEQD